MICYLTILLKIYDKKHKISICIFLKKYIFLLSDFKQYK